MRQPRHRFNSARASAAARHPGKYHGRTTRSCRSYVVMLGATDRT